MILKKQPGRIIGIFESLIFAVRPVVLAAFAVLTAFMAFEAMDLRISAGFDKMLPNAHPYIETFQEKRVEFGGGDRITIALLQKDGDIFNEEFFVKLKEVHDELFFMRGIYRPSVKSIYSPDVWYIDIIEGGYAGGAVVPADFKPVPAALEQVRLNIIKGEQEGRLVANGFAGAVVTGDLQTQYPDTGLPVDYQEISRQLDEIREKYQTENISIHIIGFAKSTGDIADGARSVILFFFVTVAITALLLFWYTKAWRLALMPLISAGISVICQLGTLNLLGFGLDPMNMLLPFLIIALGISHGIQMVTQWRTGFFGLHDIETGGADSPINNIRGDAIASARRAFRLLAAPGLVAIITDLLGFGVLIQIDIDIIRELALTAVVGLSFIVLTNLILLPVLLSYLKVPDVEKIRARFVKTMTKSGRRPMLQLLSLFATTPVAVVTIAVAIMASLWGFSAGDQVQVGDVNPGVPELRTDSRYNLDVDAILSNFTVGADVLTVFAVAEQSGCVHDRVMGPIDEFVSVAKDIPGVISVSALTEVAQKSWVGYNEGHPKWHALPRNSGSLTLVTAYVEVGTGLLNGNCSVMPIYVYLTDHKAETIRRTIGVLNDYLAENPSEHVSFEFAGGNIGITAATNEAVKDAQFLIMIYIYGSIILLILIIFRSVKAVLMIVPPLLVVSFVAYIVMSRLGVGLKVNTLPVASLGAGIGVDYGLYIFSALMLHLKSGLNLREAYQRTLEVTGRAVVFTGITLSIGVSTWIFSDLQFQADVGMMLTFKFLLSMIVAVTVLPAIGKLVNIQAPESPKKGETTRPNPPASDFGEAQVQYSAKAPD